MFVGKRAVCPHHRITIKRLNRDGRLWNTLNFIQEQLVGSD
jgi:hypothetical protein